MLRIFIIAVLCATIIVSCSKSEDDGPSNSFVTKGQTFELTNGFISHDSAGSFMVTLANGDYDTLDEIPGSQGIFFLFKSPENTVLMDGEYHYVDLDILPNRGFQGEIYMYDSAFFEIDSGKVTINNQGDHWNLNINVGYNNIQTLTGIYNGTFKEADPN